MLEQILSHDETFSAPEWLKAQANLKDLEAEHARSIADPDAFWGSWAARFEWFTPWEKVMDWNYPDHRWFVGGETNITLNALDRHADGANRNKVALIWIAEDGSERKVTYYELRQLVSRLASGLRSLGVEKGDRVVIYMPLTLEGVLSMLACARLGAVHSVVYAGMGVGALRDRIVDAGAKVVIAGNIGMRRGKGVDLRSIVDQAVEDLPLRHVIWYQRGVKTELQPREVDFDELMAQSKPDVAPVPVDSEHPLYILYTSGSTGKPKGVVHVHGGYMVGTSYHLRTFYDVKDSDVFWATSDIGWVVGHSYIVYAPLVEGVTSVFREGAPDWPDPGIFWKCVEQYGVNVMFTAPTAVRMFMKFGAEYVSKYDLSTLRLIAVAGEPLNPEAMRWAKQHLLDEGKRGFVADNWWQTELGGPTIATPITKDARPGAAGLPLPGVEAEVVDETGNAVPKGKGGLLALKRPFPHMMRTIWGSHSRYEQYWNEIPNCYAAGDVASWDEDGYISVLGRSDDVLNVAGHRIGTADVESALITHPSVAESAVIGIPDALKGEAIKAFVVLRFGEEPNDETRQSIIEHVRRELGPIATPSQVAFTEKLPKTRSGKIVRRLLKAQELGKDPGDLSTLED
ncbi:MAG: acetate--CoA ligase [Caldilinea sp.]|nr:acetate--CoA ligase [Caldilineaceae bacterium]MCO5210152.1 acetate--CoA ligase [Caldilinea sp.]